MQDTVQDRMELEMDLREALAKAEFFLAYQPTLDLSDMRPTGAEALIRWKHPTRGDVPPGVLLPIAERTGLMPQLTLWVLEHAVAQAARDDVGVFEEGADGVAVSRRVIAQLHSAVVTRRVSHSDAVRVLERLARDGAVPSESAEDEMLRFDDSLYLAQTQQFGKISDVKSEVEAFLRDNAA